MKEIKRLNEYVYEASAMVINGIARFSLTNRLNFPVFKAVYKDSAEFITNNSHFVYSFSDCGISEDNKELKVKINRLFNGKYMPANNIKVYMKIKGEKNEYQKEMFLLFLLSFITIGLVLFGKSPILLALLNVWNV